MAGILVEFRTARPAFRFGQATRDLATEAQKKMKI